MWVKVGCKELYKILVIQNILGLLVSTLTTDGKYCLLNREKLTHPIQMQRSRNQITILMFFCVFEIQIKFWAFSTKIWHRKLIYFRNYRLRNARWHKCLKDHVSQHLLTSNIENSPKHCWSLHDSIMIIFIDHCELNWIRKSLF